MDPTMVIELIEAYNRNPNRYTDEEAEFIATLSQAIGRDFNRESKPIRKGLFDMVDSATLGLMPDSLRPVSRGDSVYGESDSEKFAGFLGEMAGGTALGAGIGYGALRGARGIASKFRGGVKSGGTGGQSNNLLNLTSGTKNKSTKRLNPYSSDDIDIEIRRLENMADMGDYYAYEQLDDLYKYRDGFSGNIDYRRRFNFGRYDNIDRRLDELPF